MNKILFFLLILLPTIASAQRSEEEQAFAQLFYQIMITADSDPQKAMHQADSLYIHSTSRKKQIRALMLSANILEKQERRLEGIEYALKALEICKQEKDYSFEARIYGFLSTQSRNIGYYDQGKHYLQKGIEVSSKIENQQQVERYLAMANHELAEYAFEEKDYDTALEKIELAILTYQKEKSENERYFILGEATGFKARSYAAMDQHQKALNAFIVADSLINKSGAGNTIYAALIYQGIGDVYFIENKMDSAIAYLKKAREITEQSKNNKLKESVYKSLATYYEKKGDVDSFAYYVTQHQHLLTENQRASKKMVNEMYHQLQESSKGDKKYWFILGGSLLVTFIGSTFIIINRRTKRLRAKENEAKSKVVRPQIKISKNAEEAIKDKLKAFEASNEFLRKDISFPQLTGILDTNAKYLSHYLKNHYDKDYTTYINDLRIHYIIDRLKSDTRYLEYKISYLADESGFATHSTFSSNFKRVTGISPSEFIGSLRSKESV
jgi:AraC-like DNA-binding protein